MHGTALGGLNALACHYRVAALVRFGRLSSRSHHPGAGGASACRG
jgi:hypothetical protein